MIGRLASPCTQLTIEYYLPHLFAWHCIHAVCSGTYWLTRKYNVLVEADFGRFVRTQPPIFTMWKQSTRRCVTKYSAGPFFRDDSK
jgi:hypothetical protein